MLFRRDAHRHVDAGQPVDADVGDAPDTTDAVWDAAERQALQDHIAARRPFLDFVFHQRDGLGLVREFRVSGQPMFDQSCRFQGYRGVGVEMAMRR